MVGMGHLEYLFLELTEVVEMHRTQEKFLRRDRKGAAVAQIDLSPTPPLPEASLLFYAARGTDCLVRIAADKAYVKWHIVSMGFYW